jgi:hypothetical protein
MIQKGEAEIDAEGNVSIIREELAERILSKTNIISTIDDD